MNILFIHQNFPGQFKHLAPALVSMGNEVVALTVQRSHVNEWNGVKLCFYKTGRVTSPNIHPWVADFETKTIRAEACLQAAISLKESGFHPDVVISHPGWGESMFIKHLWPETRLGIYAEYYYHAQGADVGFDQEFATGDQSDACRIYLKNINNLLHMEMADGGISPTQWQAGTYPERFQKNITVTHDGIDTNELAPNDHATLEITKNNGEDIKLTKNDQVVTFVNRNLEPLRGYHIFMRSLPELLKNNPKTQIVIVGGNGVSYGKKPKDGETWAKIFAEEVRSKLTQQEWNRVHFVGRVPYQNFIKILQISTVHVYLTYPFVLSWSLLEAMSVGCAIVASNTPPVLEVIKNNETGRLVNFFEPNTLASEVVKLLNDQGERKKLGSNARNFAMKNYDLKKVCLPKQIAWVNQLMNSSDRV